MLPSSVEEGKLWPKAMAGVVRPARVPTTPRWLPPVLPLLIQGGELFLVLMSPCIVATVLHWATNWNELEPNGKAQEEPKAILRGYPYQTNGLDRDPCKRFYSLSRCFAT